MKPARFIAAARRELLNEVAYYTDISDDLAARFRAAVEDTVQLAEAYPHAGSPASMGTRRLVVQGFPFSVIYRARADDIVVMAIAHHARLPGYWSSRSLRD